MDLNKKIATTKIKKAKVSLTTYCNGNTVAYKMYVEGKLLFSGTDYKPSDLVGRDSLDASLNLLGLLSMGVNDTDDTFFENYTPEQYRWASEDGNRQNLDFIIADIETDSVYKTKSLKQIEHIIH